MKLNKYFPIALTIATFASAAQYPTDAGVIDVTKAPYYAPRDSGACMAADATAAIQSAIRAAGVGQIVYIPNGCYTITNTLWWQTTSGFSSTGKAFTQVIGQSRAGVTLFVPANSTNFQSTANCAAGTYEGFVNGSTGCHAVIYTCSIYNFNFPPPSYCSGEDAYQNTVQDLTIRIGANNPGAIGVDLLVSNTGAIRNVTIKSDDSTPLCGLELSRYQNGPGYAQNITITGFRYGVISGSYSYGVPEQSYTLEHISMSGQRTAGWLNYNQPMFARDITYVGAGPAIENFGVGRITLVTASFTGRSGSVSAFQNNAGGGVVFLRAIACSGFRSCLSTNGTVTGGNSISEYASQPVQSVYSSVRTSLNLPISEAPTYTNPNFSTDWANVKSYGAAANCKTDDTAAIQAAMNSGKPVVYFPWACYRVDGNPHPVVIPATVRLIEGLGSCIAAHGNSSCAGPGGNYVNERTPFTSHANGNIIFQDFHIEKTTVGPITYTGSGSLTIRDVFDLTRFQSKCGSCNIYWEDTAITGAEIIGGPDAHFWCRQCNTETLGTHVEVSGGTAWMLGWKTEGAAIGGSSGCTISTCGILWAHNNAVVEILGTWFKINSGRYGTAFLIEDSNVSIANPSAGSGYSPVYSEKRSGQTKTLNDDNFYGRGIGTALYSASTVTY